MKEKAAQDKDAMEDEEVDLELADKAFDENSDLCQKLMERYEKSSAPQHRHLCASAAAMRAILQDEDLPLTPPAYFAATINSINDAAEALDSNAIVALSSFLSILLPLVPSESLPPAKAIDAVSVIIKLLDRPPESVSTSTVRSLIKSLGVLMSFCDLEDWGGVKVPFETILRFCADKRPKVRRCAQACIKKVFMSFQCSIVIKEASKVVFSSFRNYMLLAVELSNARTVDGSKNEMLLKPEHLEVLHMLNTLKPMVQHLSDKVGLKMVSKLYKLLTCQFSPLTRHILDIIEAFFESSRPEIIIPEAESIIMSLASYVSSSEKNPVDTVMSAATLIKMVLDKLHVAEPSISIRNLPLVFGSLAGLLNSEAVIASRAAGILKELINHHIDRRIFLPSTNLLDDSVMDTPELIAIKSTCILFENMLNTCGGILNEQTLEVISDLFLRLGDISYFYMKGIVVKLADLMTLAKGDMSGTKHLQDCIGSAVVAMGPEKILALIPVSLHAEEFTCSNIWLVPILKKYVTGASLEYYMEHIIPLAESLQRACCKVKKSRLRQDLQDYAHGFWGLLPAFCFYPTDTYQKFEPLAKLFIDFLKKDSSMHVNIALALQELVNQNRSILRSIQEGSECVKDSIAYTVGDSFMESRRAPFHYSKKIARKNIKAMSSCSVDLLQALTDVFFDSTPERRTHLKEAIGCISSITETSEVKRIFLSSLEKLKPMNRVGEFEKLDSHSYASIDTKQGGNSKKKDQEDSQRSMIMEFASCLVGGANEDLIDLLFCYIKPALEETDTIFQSEAYHTLSRILEEHTWFYSSRLDELLDLLLGLKSPVDITCLRSRFACFQILLVRILKSDLEEKNTKIFLILNEIILTLKDSNEGARKAAYDVLVMISSSLKNSSFANPTPYQRLFSMIMGYLSGVSPHIMSGAVAALSLLIYKDSDVCFSVPDLVPSVLVLLQSKAVEVIKAVLGFMKVLVSCLQAKDLQKLLSDIVNGILPWSSVSRNHFRSKVIIVLEIVIRKCGSASVESIVPEKYRGFIKTVLEQRHGKTSSKETGTADGAPELVDSSLRGERKRAHGELVEKGSRASGTQEKRKKKRKFDANGRNHPLKSTGNGTGNRWVNKTSMAQAKKNNGRQFDKNNNGNGGKGRMERRLERKTGKAPVPTPAGSSKFHKRKVRTNK